MTADGRAGSHHLAAAGAGFGPHVDDPVGLGHDVQIVFDHHHGVAGVDQPVQHVDEFLHVGHVQSHRGFIEHVQRVRRHLPRRAAFGSAHLRELGDQLDALGLATGKRRARAARA